MRAFHLPHQLVCIAESTLKKPNRNKPCWYETPQVTWFHVYGFRLPKQIASYDLKARCKMFRNMNRNTTMNFPLTLTCLRVGIELVGVWVYVNIWRAVVKNNAHNFQNKTMPIYFHYHGNKRKSEFARRRRRTIFTVKYVESLFLLCLSFTEGEPLKFLQSKLLQQQQQMMVCVCALTMRALTL